ncbi:hypothetical protein Tco_0067072 [Tanacetum coccineum]
MWTIPPSTGILASVCREWDLARIADIPGSVPIMPLRSLLGSNVRNIMSPPADSSSNNVHAVDVRRPRSIFSMWGGTCRLPPPAPTDLVAVVATAIWSLDCPPDCSLSRFCVPRLSEESSEDELTLLRRLRHCPRSPELGGLSFGERLCPSLLWTKSRCQQPITER